jgi:predicted HicB family RNase H-like nuclease
MERKKISSSLQSKKAEESKEELIIKKIEGDTAIKQLEGETEIRKMTVEIPELLHRKLKVAAGASGKKIKDIIIELIDKM